MGERLWQPSNDLEAEVLPEANSSTVPDTDKIDRGGAIAATLRELERMRAHRSGNPSSGRLRRSHVATIRDVRPAPCLIGAHEIGADHVSVHFRDKHFVPWRAPISETVLLRHVRGQG